MKTKILAMAIFCLYTIEVFPQTTPPGIAADANPDPAVQTSIVLTDDSLTRTDSKSFKSVIKTAENSKIPTVVLLTDPAWCPWCQIFEGLHGQTDRYAELKEKYPKINFIKVDFGNTDIKGGSIHLAHSDEAVKILEDNHLLEYGLPEIVAFKGGVYLNSVAPTVITPAKLDHSMEEIAAGVTSYHGAPPVSVIQSIGRDSSANVLILPFTRDADGNQHFAKDIKAQRAAFLASSQNSQSGSSYTLIYLDVNDLLTKDHSRDPMVEKYNSIIKTDLANGLDHCIMINGTNPPAFTFDNSAAQQSRANDAPITAALASIPQKKPDAGGAQTNLPATKDYATDITGNEKHKILY